MMETTSVLEEPFVPDDFLNVSGIHKQTATGFLLREISFAQQRHQRLVLAGATGSGKSTLLKIIAGLVQPDGGEVRFENKRVPGPDEKLLPGHPRIAYLSQYFELRNNYFVHEELESVNQLGEKEAVAVYDVCRISHLLKRRTNQLSGGEKQRIVAARLLTTAPALFLLDEPYSNLDMEHKQVMKSVVQDISERLNITCMLVSHDPLDSLSWADEILVLKEGQLIQKDVPQIIYRNPVDAYTAGLFGTYNLIPPTLAAAFGMYRPSAKEKQLLVRPEQFAWADGERPAVPGTIQNLQFFGAHSEAEVALAGTVIRMRTEQNGLERGDAVSVSLKMDEPWFV